MGKYIVWLVCIMFYSASWTQTFSSDRAKFAKEFQKTLTDYGKGEFHDFAKSTLPDFLTVSKELSDDYFKRMVETCNLMATKKLDPYPEIYQYVFSVYSLVHGQQSDASFQAWHSSVDKLLDNRNIKKFKDFIESSAGFFSERKIAESSNFNWYYFGGSYSFEFSDKPYINLNGGTLVCRVTSSTRSNDKNPYIDSTVISNTSGVFDPILKKWDGKGGVVTWEKVGLPKDKTFATLNNYNIACKTSAFNADSVLLTTPYFTKPIMGSFSERAFIINREEDKIFPQFMSYEKRLKIKNIKENVDYDGGFSMRGASFVGLGTPTQPAKIVMYREAKPFIKCVAQEVYIYTEKIRINNAATVLLFNNGDSISHPGMLFTYDLSKKNVEFTRDKTGTAANPFRDSYHQLDIYVPKITWKTDEKDLIYTYEYGTSQEQRVANFESTNYFDNQLYDRMQGMEAVNPLAALSGYAYKYDEYVMNEGKAASALGKTIDQAKPILFQMASNGFITYDLDAKMVTVNPKLDNFVKSKSGKKDYDNLIFVSDMRPKELKGYTDEQIQKDEYLKQLYTLYKKQTEERRLMTYFGKMSLSSLEMELFAVDQVSISAIQNTTVFPDESKVLITQNRNFDFHGWVNSGKIEIMAESAKFVYADFKILLTKTGESVFRVNPLRTEDGNRPIPMLSAISGITGEILIDDPTNRSGINPKITDFPKLNATKPAYVYYNSKAIYHGVYDSTRFYYTIAPFLLDSLDNFNDKQLRFKGELTSAGIFPKINQELKVMPDYSFGFSATAPAGGYDFYGTGAKYENKIMLSNNGLQGAGTINFVQSTSVSKSLLAFLPDSTVGIVKFTNKPIEAGVQFPDVVSDEAYMTYVPKKNYLKAASTPKADLSFFNGEAKLRGTAIVSPKGMTGNGLMSFKTATTISDNYSFTRWNIDADTTSFNLKNTFAEDGEDELAFKAENVKAAISFKSRDGKFVSNKGSSILRFPVNKYICKMDQFSWEMDNSELAMESNDKGDVSVNSELDLVGPNFFSTHPKQDSLQFRAPKARYDLKQRTIFCDKVPFLEIADARIYPDSMKVTIRKNAKIDLLENAKIVANAINKYHTIIHAQADVTGRKVYTATGEYPYYDRDSNVTNFKLDKIWVDSSYQTVATGNIDEKAGFKLSKEFDYYGQVKIKAAVKEIYFNGATRINHSCEKFERTWMSFNAPIDPKNIQIPVAEKMKNLQGDAIAAGIVWRNSPVVDSIKLYPTFLSEMVKADDPVVMTATGFLQYNDQAKEFQIGTKEKLLNRGEKGNFLALHTESCSLNGEGVINLGMDYGDVTVDAVGVANYDQNSGKTSMNITLAVNMPVDKGVMEDIATKINAVEGLKPMDFASTTYEQALVQWTDQKTADKIKSDYTIKGEVKKLPSEVEKPMVITGLRLVSFDKPSMEEKGLITDANAAVLVSMYEKPVMKYVPMRAFFQQIYSENGGDKFGIHIDIPGGREYYFDYSMNKKDGTLRIISSDGEFNTTVSAIKEDKRKTKNFIFEASTQRVYLSKFLRLFE